MPCSTRSGWSPATRNRPARSGTGLTPWPSPACTAPPSPTSTPPASSPERAQPSYEPPAWVGLIDAYCHFDTAGLTEAARNDRTGLALYLRFLASENYAESPQHTILMADEALAANPEALDLVEARCKAGGISNLHEATVLGPRVLAEHLPRRLLEMPGLPTVVAALARSKADVVAIRDALGAANDTAELTWAVLGRLAAEAQFVHDWRRVEFMHDYWNVPVAGELARCRPELKGHPYRMFVESYGYGPGQSARGARRGAQGGKKGRA